MLCLQENQSGMYSPACYSLGFEIPQVKVCGVAAPSQQQIQPLLSLSLLLSLHTQGSPGGQLLLLPAQNFQSLLEAIKAFL